MSTGRVACIVFGIVCLALGMWSYILTGQRDLARQDAAAWQESAEKNRTALEDITATHTQLQKALEEREKTLVALEQEREQQRMKLGEAMRNDKTVSDFGNIPVPPAIDRLLR